MGGAYERATQNFANDAVIDNQGNVVSGVLPATGAGGIGNFGRCSTPEIEFGVGFDGRRESSFQPKDKGRN
ncbi:hypothetical protein NLJ89_g12410 [Agrocybe chaxingu]|uniref:Uncharacterized protein n=1 Tax=Agrocybe chaxingu TaxID=84603 RepID=A0A9W8JQJ7_9AGAR|nr:hypothetical protein NLJ89_g12410 [Agrocybe chaxingu]